MNTHEFMDAQIERSIKGAQQGACKHIAGEWRGPKWVCVDCGATIPSGFDADKRMGNCAIPGIGVNSPAMMKARAEFETIAETMGDLDLSEAEWESIPKSVQRRLIARVFRTRKSPTELAAERGQS